VSAPGTSPRVTALIDTYNYGRYIGEAIESVLAQDFPAREMEIVVVDDGSTDETGQVVARYGERVRYFHKPNGGQASALNLGFRQARGEIIALLDADDVWRPEKTRRVVEAFDANPEAGMAYHAFFESQPGGGPVPQTDFPAISGRVLDRVEDLLTYRGQATSGTSFRRKALEALLPIPESLRIIADGYLVLLMPFVAPVAAIAEPLAEYRLHGGNLFSFDKNAAAEKLVRKLACQNLLVEEITRWLERNGRMDEPPVRDYVRRQRLAAREIEFALHSPGRARFFAHLREEARLYAPIRTRRYRLFKWLTAMAALLLGYDLYQRTLRQSYREHAALLQLRETFFPYRLENSVRT
jgi:glycosyltransferase involved in cell wall biosynthesis